MGKRGPKPQFFDVACPNKNCKLYGLTNQDNITGNGTYIVVEKKQEDMFATNVAKYSMIIQVLLSRSS